MVLKRTMTAINMRLSRKTCRLLSVYTDQAKSKMQLFFLSCSLPSLTPQPYRLGPFSADCYNHSRCVSHFRPGCLGLDSVTSTFSKRSVFAVHPIKPSSAFEFLHTFMKPFAKNSFFDAQKILF